MRNILVELKRDFFISFCFLPGTFLNPSASPVTSISFLLIAQNCSNLSGVKKEVILIF